MSMLVHRHISAYLDLMAAQKRRALGSRLRLNLTFPLSQINYNIKQIIQNKIFEPLLYPKGIRTALWTSHNIFQRNRFYRNYYDVLVDNASFSLALTLFKTSENFFMCLTGADRWKQLLLYCIDFVVLSSNYEEKENILRKKKTSLSQFLNRWFSRYVIAAMLVYENKRFLISSFCSCTSNCTLQHCYLCP